MSINILRFVLCSMLLMVTFSCTMPETVTPEKPVTYTVTFDSQGGSPVAMKTVTAPATAVDALPSAPMRSGYTFGGWFTLAGGLGTQFLGTTPVSADIKVYAKWTSINNNVTFDANGGVGTMADQFIPSDSSATLNANAFTQTGYTFAGWNTAVDASGTAYAQGALFNMATASVTLYAQWTLVIYDITYNLNNGVNGANPGTYTVATPTITLAAATRTGYTFQGWYSEGGLTTLMTEIALGSSENKTFWAKWTPVVYTVTFAGNSVSAIGGMADQSIPCDASALLTANTFARSGYTFTGWTTNADGTGATYADKGSFTMGAGNVTLYAKWTASSNNVSFNANGGTGTMTDQFIASDSSATLHTNTYTRAGYTFTGWHTDAAGLVGSTYGDGATFNMATSSVTLYAQWSLNTYSITYNLDNGSDPGNPGSYNVTTSTITLLPATRTGFEFLGWYAEAGFTTAVSQIAEGSTGAKTLYAKWTEIYTIIYSLNSGTNDPSNPANYTALTPPITLASATRTGYTFGGWYSDSGLTTLVTQILLGSTGPKTLYAKWTANIYQITFNKNNVSATGTMGNQTIACNASANLVAHGFALSGYSFVGWNTQSDGLGTSYANLASYTMGAGNVTLYVIWTGNTYTVTYDSQNATVAASPASQSVTIPVNTVSLPTAPTRTGFTFGGWFTQPGGLGTQFLGTTTITSDLIVYAKWTYADITSPNIGLLKVVPAGQFQRDYNLTNIAVITNPYLLAEKEITREQFQSIMGSDPSNTTNSSGTTDPVQRVNWYHAIAFCNKLSLAEGLSEVYTVSGVDFSTLVYSSIPTASDPGWNSASANWNAAGYRLPTEMEWMWAAMGGTGSYTKDFAGFTGSNLLDDYAWTPNNALLKTHPVGTKLPNELGLYDMSGNVAEWCWDRYASIYPSGTVIDDRGAGVGTDQVVRGGSWSMGSFVPVGQRYFIILSTRSTTIGFRVARNLVQ